MRPSTRLPPKQKKLGWGTRHRGRRNRSDRKLRSGPLDNKFIFHDVNRWVSTLPQHEPVEELIERYTMFDASAVY